MLIRILQVCIVHLVRHLLFYVSHKDRKEIAADLKMIYQAATLEEADYQLAKFADKWNMAYPNGCQKLAAELDESYSDVFLRA